MNKFTARGLAESAYAEECDIIVVVPRRAIAVAISHFEQAVIDLGLPVRSNRNVNGSREFWFESDGGIRIVSHERGRLRGCRADVVYFDLRPTEADTSDADLVVMPSTRGAVVEA